MSRGKLQKVFHDLAELGCNLPLRRNCGLCTRFGRDAVPDAIPLAFRSNGDVLGCLSLGDDFIEANLLETPLAEIWNSGGYFQRFRKKEDLLCGQCVRCTFGKKCKACCTAMAISSTDNMGDNTYCVRRLEEKSLLQELFS